MRENFVSSFKRAGRFFCGERVRTVSQIELQAGLALYLGNL
jgi:hypothetical protein